MSKFIKTTLLFLSSLFFIIILLCVLIGFFNRRPENFKLASNITTIFIGDSHLRYTVDDSKIKNSVNLAVESEPYYYSYLKLQRYLGLNKQIKQVFLGYSYHNLSNYFDGEVINNKHLYKVSSRYFFILPLSEQINYLLWNSDSVGSYLKTAIINTDKKFEGFVNGHVDDFAKKTAMDIRLESQFYTNGKLNHFSTFNLTYLKKIIILCKAENVDLILLNTPIHPYFRNKIPNEYVNKYNEIIKLGNLKIIDLSSLPLTYDCYFVDGDHVSRKGANITSEEIQKILITQKYTGLP
jgi:hypothetical protein